MNVVLPTHYSRMQGAPRFFVGIHRECDFLLNNLSPSSCENPDSAILNRVAAHLQQQGCGVEIFRDVHKALLFCEGLCATQSPQHVTIFNMCRDDEHLALLRTFRRRYPWVRISNSPESTWKMKRKALYSLMQHLDIPLPKTCFLSVQECLESSASLELPLWIKLPGHHHVEGFGVEYVRDQTSLGETLGAFTEHSQRSAAKTEVILQGDLRGQEAKFYAVYSRERDQLRFFGVRESLPFIVLARLQKLCVILARALDVQVFGGDCIVQGDTPFIIDFNSWPSFHGFIDEGGAAIAACIFEDEAPKEPIERRVP